MSFPSSIFDVVPTVPNSVNAAPAPVSSGGGGFWDWVERNVTSENLSRIARAGSNVQSAYYSIRHAAEVGREQVRRIAQAEGISELEAAAILARRASQAVITADQVDRNRNTLILVGVGALALVLVLAMRKG